MHFSLTSIFRFVPIAVIMIFVAAFGYIFSVSDKLATFSDDSATYLIMAQHFSPFTDSPESFGRVLENRHLPPGFPVVLALFDAGKNLPLAHTIVLFEFMLSLLFVFLLASKLLKSNYLAGIVVALLLFMPWTWIILLSVISENQYIFLSLASLYVIVNIQDNRLASHAELSILGILLSFSFLTRSIGVSIILPFFLVILINHKFIKGCKFRSSILFLAGLLLPVIIWSMYSPGGGNTYVEDIYIILISGDVIKIISNNISSIYLSWVSNFILFWPEFEIVRLVLLALIGSLSLAGLMLRLKYVDGQYVLLYMMILLVWPYPNEMNRFLYPLMPLLLIFIFIALQRLAVYFRYDILLKVVFSVIIISLEIPALLFMSNRYILVKREYSVDLSHSPEVYYYPSPSKAFSTALLSQEYIKLMKKIPNVIDKHSAKILALKPHFVTWCSGVYAEMLPFSRKDLSSFLHQIYENKAQYILVNGISTRENPDGVNLLPKLSPFTTALMRYKDVNTDKVVFALLKINKEKLSTYIMNYSKSKGASK